MRHTRRKRFANPGLIYSRTMHAPHRPSTDGPPIRTPADAVRELADGLGQMLRIAGALIEGGREVDLAGLEGQIGLLCAKTLDLPMEEGRAMRPLLHDLLARIDTLTATIAAPARPPRGH
jgi:hypothetical protein